jgi:hypothetical protein
MPGTTVAALPVVQLRMTRLTARKQDKSRKLRDAELDRALAETFPASDPFSVGQITSTEPPARPVDRKAPLIVIEGKRRGAVTRRG